MLARAPLLLLSLVLGGCKVPRLSVEPWDLARPGSVSVGVRPAVYTLYEIDGDFTSMDFMSGGTIEIEDSGDILGRFGMAVRADYFVGERWTLGGGLDYRTYDIEGLTPSDQLDIEVDEIDSLQYFVAARHLFPPLKNRPRLRPYTELSLAYLPGVDVSFEVDLSSFGSSNLLIESEGEGYWVGAVAGGLLFHLWDTWIGEVGLVYELPITELDTDLSFEIAGTDIPLTAAFEPRGFVLYWGLSRVFRP